MAQLIVVHREMNVIMNFSAALVDQLPQTYVLLADAGLCIHDAVDRITLHGSRGPQGGARPDSDLDLCLIINAPALAATASQEVLLRAVLQTTLQHWQSKIEIDLAAIFDKFDCGLRCFDQCDFIRNPCNNTVDCMGLFKIQKGFDGFLSGPAVDCSKMYPFMTIWNRKENTAQ
jgi:hypothetical protein